MVTEPLVSLECNLPRHIRPAGPKSGSRVLRRASAIGRLPQFRVLPALSNLSGQSLAKSITVSNEFIPIPMRDFIQNSKV